MVDSYSPFGILPFDLPSAATVNVKSGTACFGSGLPFASNPTAFHFPCERFEFLGGCIVAGVQEEGSGEHEEDS